MSELLLVKLDIEGAQSSVFQNHTEWVEKSSLIILELDDDKIPWQGNSINFFRCLSRYDFDYLIRGENIFCFRHWDRTG